MLMNQFSHITARLDTLDSSGLSGAARARRNRDGSEAGEDAAVDDGDGDGDGDGDDELEPEHLEVRSRKRKVKKARPAVFSDPKYSQGIQKLQVRRYPIAVSAYSCMNRNMFVHICSLSATLLPWRNSSRTTLRSRTRR